MKELYRARKSERLYQTLSFWNHEDMHGASIIPSEWEYAPRGCYVEFSVDRRGLNNLKKSGHRVQKRVMEWRRVKKCAAINDVKSFTDDFRVVAKGKAIDQFIADLAVFSFRLYPPHGLIPIPTRGDIYGGYVKFAVRESKVINNLVKKGYRIERGKIKWRDV